MRRGARHAVRLRWVIVLARYEWLRWRMEGVIERTRALRRSWELHLLMHVGVIECTEIRVILLGHAVQRLGLLWL